ncbi:hypothetical protein KKE48_03720 [Patescibacteria group bacterium]|nr:hypothetical protein [Patescibacteria group bacterium]MBU1499948.1 hypothetical protein [Patescibacteria group bacterium]
MTSISAVKAIRIINQSRLQFVTPTAISQLFDLTKKNTVYKLLQRLEKYQLIHRLNHGQYLVTNSSVTDFTIANFLITPSYISFESALSFYGILAQFPYPITSATTKKSVVIDALNKEFQFTRLSGKFFFGYQSINRQLIACPEKALIDSLYLMSKKLRWLNLDELDLTPINKNRLKQLALKISFRPFIKLFLKLKL